MATNRIHMAIYTKETIILKTFKSCSVILNFKNDNSIKTIWSTKSGKFMVTKKSVKKKQKRMFFGFCMGTTWLEAKGAIVGNCFPFD